MKPLRNICFCHPKDLKFFKEYLSNWYSKPLIFKKTSIMKRGIAKVTDFKNDTLFTFAPSLNPKLANMHKKN